MATQTLIESSPGLYTTVVASSAITNKTAAVVPYARPQPFTLSVAKSSVNRTQAALTPPRPAGDDFMVCVTDRTWNDAAGRRETLAGLVARGHTHFRCGQQANTELMYQAGYNWLFYGQSGMNENVDFSARPDNALTYSIQEIYAIMKGNNYITNRQGVNVVIANFEPHDFTLEDWPIYNRKGVSWVSTLNGQTYTMQQLFDSMGGGLAGINELNRHLRAKQLQMHTLWVQMYRKVMPSARVCNGDYIPFQQLNSNGELVKADGTIADIRSYQQLSKGDLIAASGEWALGPVRGGQITFSDGEVFNFTGVPLDHCNVMVQYYYYNEIYCKSADYQQLTTTADAVRDTVDYWHSKFFFARRHVYESLSKWEIRNHLFGLIAADGGPDYRQIDQIDMFEHMYESNTVTTVSATSSQTFPTAVEEVDYPPFLRWLPAPYSQKLDIHSELIEIRLLQARIRFQGVFVWWEGQGAGFDFDYTQGKYAYFHPRSREVIQRVLSDLEQENDCFAEGSTVVIEGIPMRWRQNNGAWSAWGTSLSAIQAQFFRNGSTRVYQPLIASRGFSNKRFYTFFMAQENTDVTDIEFRHVADGPVYSVKLTGCKPAWRTVRTGLPADVVTVTAPTVANAYGDKTINANGTQIFEIPTNTFTGSNLTWSGSLSNGNALPGNITFNPSTRQFSVVVSDTQTNGTTYNLRVTVTNTAGSASEDFVVTVNRVAVGTIAPAGYGNVYAANSTYVAQPETARPSASPWRSFIDNGITKAGINVRVGSVLDWLSYNGDNFNRINTPVNNSGWEDAGRQVMDAAYVNPNGDARFPYTEGAYVEDGLSSFTPTGIGNNPVQGGNIGDAPRYGQTIIHSVQNGVIYAKVLPVQWELRKNPQEVGDGVWGQMHMESWQRFDPNEPRVVRRHVRWTMFRTDPYSNLYPTPRQQELPCAYIHPSYTVFLYCTGKPYTNAPLQDYPIVSEGRAEDPRFSTEPMIIAKNPSNNRVFILYVPFSGRVVAARHPNGPNDTFPASYIASAPMLSCDKDGVYDFDAALGEFENEAAARSWLYAQPRWDGKFEVRFDQGAKSRFGCTLYNCYDQLEKNIVDGITLLPITNNENGGKDFGITLPERWIDADTHKHMYIRASFQGSPNVFLSWRKGAQEFAHQLTMNADGQVRTVDINLTNVPDWSGDLVGEVKLKRGIYGQGMTALSNDQWHIKWISYQNLS